MSFLNPVSEPVLRFSSTDVGAPQINYNARVAGDVKTVLKGCLVTGYGAKASAAWSIVNEVDHVAEFVSPAAAMSDYRLGIDDTSASSTTWYHQHLDLRVNPNKNVLTKNHSNIKLNSAKNGWQLLVTAQGVVFIEILDDNIALGLVTRVTYWGRIKSALKNDGNTNIAFWSVGHSSGDPTNFWSASEATYNIGIYTSAKIVVINAIRTTTYISDDTTSAVEPVSPWYLYNSANFIGVQPAVLLTVLNNDAERFKILDTVFDGKSMLSVPVSYATGDLDRYNKYTRTLLLALDNWEY